MRWDIEIWPANPLDDIGFTRPWWVPRPFWRRTRWFNLLRAIPIWGPVLVVLLVVVLPRSGVPPRLVPKLTVFVLVLGIVIVLLAGGALQVYQRAVFRRFKAALTANDYLLCLWCGYPLKGLPDRHCCPECGTPYEATRLADAWKHWVQKRRLPKWAREQHSTNTRSPRQPASRGDDQR